MTNIELPENNDLNENDNTPPCLEGNCSWCCNPVRIPYHKQNGINLNIPKNDSGEEIWTDRDEILAPLNGIDRIRVKTYDCKNYNHDSGLCNDYENRPDICKNTSCINSDSNEDKEEQCRKLINTEFLKLK